MICSDKNTLPKTREEAKRIGSVYYFTGKPCKRGHFDKRFACSRVCYSCHNMHNKDYYERTHEHQLQRRELWRKQNPDYFKNWKIDNPNYMSEYCKWWRQINPDYPKAYYAKNKPSIIARVSKRRADKIERAFRGHENEILKVYEECERISAETGVLHHVEGKPRVVAAHPCTVGGQGLRACSVLGRLLGRRHGGHEQ